MEQKIALVTGASRGIGAAIALGLAKQGCFVVGTATTVEGASQISDAFKQVGLTGIGLTLDVTQPDQIEQILGHISTVHGEVQVLVNNAGITRDTLLMRMKEADWDQVIATNLSSVYRMSQAVLRPMMKARQGRIINVSSVVGHMGNAGQTNYAAAKAGLAGFTKSLAIEVGSRGITVNCVAPGFIDTDMTRSLSDEHKALLLQRIPMARLGKVEDVAAAVCFLASSSADYISGETLHVNGGMYMA